MGKINGGNVTITCVIIKPFMSFDKEWCFLSFLGGAVLDAYYRNMGERQADAAWRDEEDSISSPGLPIIFVPFLTSFTYCYLFFSIVISLSVFSKSAPKSCLIYK